MYPLVDVKRGGGISEKVKLGRVEYIQNCMNLIMELSFSYCSSSRKITALETSLFPPANLDLKQ